MAKANKSDETKESSNKVAIVLILLALLAVAVISLNVIQNNKDLKSTAKTTNGAANIPPKIIKPVGNSTAPYTPRTEDEKELLAVGKEYWLSKYGQDGSDVVLKNYGCHVALESVKNGETKSVLNYDGKNITEIKK